MAAKRKIPFVGVVDTTFSRVDMGAVALATIATELGKRKARVERVTVPGVKDLAAAARAFYDRGADLVIACGMVGPEDVDKTCGHESSLGLMWLRAQLGKPLLEVFVHMDEPWPRTRGGAGRARRPGTAAEIREYEEGLAFLATERTREHALNAVWMLFEPERLVAMAGTGQRQGYADEGPAKGG